MTEKRLWKEGLNSSPSFQLSHDKVHVWCASLERFHQQLAGLFPMLSSDEKARAERFYFEMDRDRFIIGRGLLRSILGGYLEMEPAQIEFVYGDHGKPAIKSAGCDNILEFNLSHSKDLAIYIFSWNRRVGIDVEYVHPMSDTNDFAKQFFSPRESIFIHSLSEEQKEESFFKIWTCKEAFLKANGNGLTIPINQVEISMTTEGSAVLSSIGGDMEQARRWRLEIFNPVPSYQAAFAVEGHAGQVILQQLDDRLQ